jgi:hexosaminidase
MCGFFYAIILYIYPVHKYLLMKTTYTFLLFLLISLSFSQNNIDFIPKPQNTLVGKGSFYINTKTYIQADENSFEANYLKEAIQIQTGLHLKITSKNNSKNIQLVLLEPKIANFNKEQYEIVVSDSEIVISALTNQGLFYGIQTLLQMVPFEKKNEIAIPWIKISDAPKYAWRGMHLDVCRHYFPITFIKKYIDYLAHYKMNTFHWHLTEDQGWRIEIKKYPKLTEVGGWRNGSMVGRYDDQKFDDKKYGGFYTQEEIKEVVAYASQRHITIIPEIEMPGHSLAALAAYPELSCTGGPFEVGKKWGVFDDVYCPKEETFTFLENVLTEVLALFPSEYIHIGGDECPKTRWKSCAHCQKIIQEKGLKDEHELQSYFIQRIEKFVNSNGRKIIGWDEILEGGLAPNAAVMSWRGTEGGIAAAKQKHYVVMTPGSHCYFDHYQGKPENEPLAIGGFTSLEKVYNFNPMPKELDLEEQKYILGAQANVWTEYILTPEQVEYMIMPRMSALAEVLWGTANPENYLDFKTRLQGQENWLKNNNINYRKTSFTE